MWALPKGAVVATPGHPSKPHWLGQYVKEVFIDTMELAEVVWPLAGREKNG